MLALSKIDTDEIAVLKNKIRELESKLLRDREQHTKHAMGEMAAAFAHEINQPLAAINIYSHTCLEQFNKNSISKKLLTGLEKIRTLSQHAGDILHRMKNFIRDGDIYLEETNINQLIQASLSYLDHQQLDYQFETLFKLSDRLPLIYVDKIKITQILLNLAQNSIEASQATNYSNIKLTIKTRLCRDFIEIHFQDNGPGIPQEIAHKIMNSYFTTKSHGTGLGLAICRTLVEAHGGKLMMKSSKKGAYFIFTLPTQHKEQQNGGILSTNEQNESNTS